MRVVDEAAEAGVKEVGCFYLGESFSNPELLIWAIGYTKTKGSLRIPDD